MSAWLATTLSVIAGGALTIISTWIADRRLIDRERERRLEERREYRAIRRDDFQRETLLALQVASQKLLRATGRMHYLDVVAFRTTGRWQRQQFPDDLSDDNLHYMTETMLLASRARDDEVRTLAAQLRERITAVSMSGDEENAKSHITAASDIQGALISRIGHLVREMDQAD